MFKYFVHTFLLFFSVSLFAQENLKPLTANINYLYGDINHASVKQSAAIPFIAKQKAASSLASLTLPFFDDFSYSSWQAYPSQTFWSDSNTYVNSGFAIAPPSIGVATFDGLNKYGYPYLPNNQADVATPSPADVLTSQPVDLSQNLHPFDSVALIFYYQARGNGEAPEINDSLLVDFYKPYAGTWSPVWFQRGNTGPNVNDTIFKRAFIGVTDTAYFHDGFKFRFRNKATTSGDFDHWNLDYVLLDKARHILTDTSYNDFAFGYVPSPLLKNYAAMPWRQYDTSEMARHVSVFIRNNGTLPNVLYGSNMYNTTNQFTFMYNYADINFQPGYFNHTGWLNYAPISHAPNNFTINPLSNFTDFTIVHHLTTGGDFKQNNDTVYQRQDFNNFYAYDDGSCEAGYYILGQGGKMAQKYTIRVSDTLRAVRIYFDPAGSLSSAMNNAFNISIWLPGSSGPGNLLFHRDSVKTVNYPQKCGFNCFSEYALTNPVILTPGTYYLGLQQKVAAGIVIGFDKNIDHSSNLYYDSGSGWTQSQIRGSLMIRPVFGTDPPTTGIKENSHLKNNLFSVYPNPVSDQFIIQSDRTEKESYTLINSIGQKITEGEIDDQKQVVHTDNLSNGIYFLILKIKGQPVQQHKIIVQH